MLNRILEQEMKNEGYTGEFTVEAMMLSFPSSCTTFLKEDGTFGATCPSGISGYFDGLASPEDALGTMWLELKYKGFALAEEKRHRKAESAERRRIKRPHKF